MSANAETRAEHRARLREQNDIIAGQSVKYKEGLAAGEEIGRREGEEIGRRQGEEIGRKRGEEIGRHDNALETARNFLSMGLTVDQVAQGTGLSLSEVEGLIKQL